MKLRSFTLVLLGAAVVSAVPAHRASAQLPIPSPSLSVGLSQWDLSGTGTSPFARLSLGLPLLLLNVEGSVGLFRPNEQGGATTYVIPEAQLQFELFPALVKPYLGAGLGFMRGISGPKQFGNQITASAAAGVRVGVPLVGLGFRGEVRARGIGKGFSGSAVELTVGVSM